MRELRVAKLRLSAEARAVERAIESGTQQDALRRLLEVEPQLGRRPEFRYLRHLFDLTFQIRAAEAILDELVELVAEQPDLPEATALLADVYERNGDRERAEVFARIALGSESESARTRASAVLGRGACRLGASEGPPDNTRILLDPDPPDDERIQVRRSQRVRASPPPVDVNAPIEAWFDYAKHQLLQRRAPTRGVRCLHSTADQLLDSALELAIGPSEFSETSLPLTRAALERIDQTVLEMHEAGSPVHADRVRVYRIAGFLLAVVLHELQGTAIETAPDDGGCKVVVPSRAGARPLPVAAAFVEGTGPRLTETYDRLAASLELVIPSVHPPRPSAPRVRVAQPATDPQSKHRRPDAPEGAARPVSSWPPAHASAPARTALPPDARAASASTAPPLAPRLVPSTASQLATSVTPPTASRLTQSAASPLVTSAVPLAGSRLTTSTTPPPCEPSLPPILSRAPGSTASASTDGLGPRASLNSMLVPSMQHPELSTSRPEAESQPLRRLDVVFRSADPPALDLELLASAFGESMLVLEVAGRTGIRLEPTPAKLEALERFLSEIRGQACSAPQLAATWQPTDREESLILSCGAVLGETIIAEYGGVWECDPKAPTDPRLFRVICEDRVAAWPMTLVYLRLKSATSNALADFLARIGRALDGAAGGL